MKKGSGSARVVYVVGFAVAFLDQVSKYVISATIVPGSVTPVVVGFFNLTFIRNDGAAFGVLRGNNFFFIVISILAVVVILALRRWYGTSSPVVKLGVGLVLGGAGGNLVDRLLHGYVIDFLDFHVGKYHWPAFNLADSSICVGVAFLVLCSMREKAR